MNERLPVAVAVIRNARGEVLISRRAAGTHQGGRWEYPGGKLEPGENGYQALVREIHEELGLIVEQARPLIRIPHDYPDRAVLLDVWLVEAYRGEPSPREGQPLRWVAPEALPAIDFPAANRPINSALRLPDCYAITPEPAGGDAFLRAVERTLAGGVRLLQLRAPSLPLADYRALAREVQALCAAARARLLLNAGPEMVEAVGAAGVHLNARRLAALESRPLEAGRWCAASCHDAAGLVRAAALGLDFAVLSPVQPTLSHPQAPVLGWTRFAALVEAAPLPVYALGGMTRADLEPARAAGAQGIAAIRALWQGD
ncbi:Nudix family hydrolase [Thiohalobacter sp. IOR34]|uniref:Nudix family hydrolase n=1 Tax=Thiohalobacter sp. IOR34 TaxID=3057176 RepID=UPI0025B1946D|nr:Nudix family hydrolase [Thiohalobacter sp. IOR34]WJW74941.1 Nudix family hydrolase [Thiohalobacter sp. IOR34]